MNARLIIVATAIAAGLGAGAFRASAEFEVSAGISIHSTTDFDAPLASLGAWVNVPRYGHCWRPSGVAADWRPYCEGHWEWTDCGWYWVSDEPWGWACCHYGSWVDDPDYGWVWLPGTEWAPAWVNWRIGNGYIGWAPCGPQGFRVAPGAFVFVNSGHFGDPIRLDSVMVNNTGIYNRTRPTGSERRETRSFGGHNQTVMVNNGPAVNGVEKATGRKFSAVSVTDAARQTTEAIPDSVKRQIAAPQKERNAPTAKENAPGVQERQAAPPEGNRAPEQTPHAESQQRPVVPPQEATPRNQQAAPPPPPSQRTLSPQNGRQSQREQHPKAPQQPPAGAPTHPTAPPPGNGNGNGNGNGPDNGGGKRQDDHGPGQ